MMYFEVKQDIQQEKKKNTGKKMIYREMIGPWKMLLQSL